ncbi:enoyl-CoA hydratase/isomerase family protein [Nocardia sp. NPDC127606]|uniref:enoyl-CoA hydratase/isomerase family protein n=1 Tax=Nocardia sp. NPDC127606 TaxID=3345406 RepID=UPI003625B9EE
MSVVSEAVVLVEQIGPVRVIVLNRPRQRNALNPALVDGLTVALAAAEHDPATKAVLIAGAGPSFCAGADLRHLLTLADAGESPVPFLRTISDLTRRIELSAVPMVAVLHGHAVAGGLEIAWACDAVLGEAGTLIGDGHIRSHLVPGAGSEVHIRHELGDSLGPWLELTDELRPVERFLGPESVVRPGRGATEGLRAAKALAAKPNLGRSALQKLLADLDEYVSVEEEWTRELATFERHWSAHDVPRKLRRFLARGSARCSPE